MSKTITEKAHAKVNFALCINGKRADGYHDLESIMVPITLYDELRFEIIDDGEIIINMDKVDIRQEDNIIYKTTIDMFEKYNIKSGIRIDVKKNIPHEAGLAGGSANCAATIKAINKLFDLQLSFSDMIDIANTHGSDTAFCVLQKPALVTGRGEYIKEIPSRFSKEFYIIKPDFGMSTKDVFTNHTITPKTSKIDVVMKALKDDDFDLLVNSWFNDLELTVNKISKEMMDLRKDLSFYTKKILMSGSGSSLIVFDITKEQLEEISNSHKIMTYKVNVLN